MVGALIVNRVLPDLSEGEFLRARLEQQSEYLKEIGERFRGQRVVRIEQSARDITHREQLRAITEQLAGADLA